jgi:exosome complex RNA-binding protein Rrp4
MTAFINTAFVVPGQVITSEAGFLRGHGTYYHSNSIAEDKTSEQQQLLVAAVAGNMSRVNKVSFAYVKCSYYCLTQPNK